MAKKEKQNQVSSEISANQVIALVKNGNLMSIIKSKTKAIAELRTRAAKDLGIKTTDCEAKEKNNIIELAGVSHWRARIVDVL